jgi:hypothetical protein
MANLQVTASNPTNMVASRQSTPQNPLVNVASMVRNSISGSGSLSSGDVHMGSIQANIQNAINRTGNSDLSALASLQSAQKYMAQAAGAKDIATRNAALANAKAQLINVNNRFADNHIAVNVAKRI